MKKLLTVLALTCALAMVATADDAKKDGKEHHKMTAEQKALREEMVKKYDTNKDGKLDKEERAKISAEDKAKMDKAGIGGHKKDEKKDDTK